MGHSACRGAEIRVAGAHRSDGEDCPTAVGGIRLGGNDSGSSWASHLEGLQPVARLTHVSGVPHLARG